MRLRVKKIGSDLTKVLKSLQKTPKVSIGHFEEDGKHPSGMTYPELMQLHHVGTGDGPGEIPARPVLTILAFKVENSPKEYFQGFRTVFKNGYDYLEAKKFFEQAGKRIANLEKSIIGNPDYLESNSPLTQVLKGGVDSPLVDTGDLKRHVKVKIEEG